MMLGRLSFTLFPRPGSLLVHGMIGLIRREEESRAVKELVILLLSR